MSKYQTPSLYNGRGADNQWMNLIYTSHDLYCGCLKPIKHLEDIIKRDECRPTEKTTGGTTATTNAAADDIAISPGDLEELFKENENTEG